ncbi:MAG: hypothetical protein JW818_04080 [Pirellulales bacterium]|nr:hypothetical protein [Pirellulales bacterium]
MMKRHLRIGLAGVVSLWVLLSGVKAFCDSPAKPVDQKTSDRKTLDKNRIEAAQGVYKKLVDEQRMGEASAEEVYRWSGRWADAVAEALGATKKTRVEAAADHLARMEELRRVVLSQRTRGPHHSATISEATRYYVVDAQIRLDEARKAAVNAIMVIMPYRYDGTWVFNDPKRGLVHEPFVAGIPRMLDWFVKDVPNAEKGFRLLFSAEPFPGYQKKLTWTRRGHGGNYYRVDDPPMEGWLCPALLKYFPEAPPEIYVKAEPKQ